MRILMLVINPMVADARVDKEAASLAASGHDVTVLATQGEDLPTEEPRDGFTIVRLPYLRTVKDAITGRISSLRERGTLLGRAASRAVWLIGGGFLKTARSAILPREYYRGLASHAFDMFDRPDAIHAHDLGTLAAAVRLSRRWARAGNRPMVVYDSHELYVEQQTNWTRAEKLLWRWHEFRWIRHADAVISVSPGIADELRRRYSLATTPTVILNSPRSEGVDPLGVTVRSDIDIDEAVRLIVYAGAVKPSRGVDRLLAALAFLPAWHVALVGATTEQLAAVTAGLPEPIDEHRVHVLPSVPSWSLPEYLGTADVGVHPLPATCRNHELALPNKLFDYAFAGIPVVANDLPEMANLITSRDLGVVCDTRSPTALATAIESVLGRTVEYDGISDLAWEHQAGKLAAVYARSADPDAS